MAVQIPHGKGNFEGEGRPIAKYRDTLQSSVQKRLNHSTCHLGCGLGWAQGIMYWMGSRSPSGSNFQGKTASHCKAYGRSTVKTAEPVDMSFGIWTRVDQWNHVLYGGSRSPHAKVQFLGERTCPDIPNHTLT